MGCRSAKGKLRPKKLITNNYRKFLTNTPEGLDIDVAYVNKDTYLIAKSNQYKYLFVEKLPSGERFTAAEVREGLYNVFTEFILYDKDLKWMRSDADRKFTKIKSFIEMLGIRWLISPPDVKTGRAERAIRSMRDLARTIVCNMEYKIPESWIPYLIKEVSIMLNIQPKKDKLSPYEQFTGLSPEYGKVELWIPFGKLISYPDLISHKNLRTQLNYGVVIGRDIRLGNLIVENIFDRRIEVITQYYEEIPIDDRIRTFYNADIAKGLCGLPTYKPQSQVPKTFALGDRYEVKPVQDAIGDAQDTESMTAVANALLININTTAYNKCELDAERYSSSVQFNTSELKDVHDGDHIVNASDALKWGENKSNDLQISEIDYIEHCINDSNITNEVIINALQYNYRDMAKIHPLETLESAKSELKGILDRGTIVPVKRTEILPDSKIIYIMTRYVEKYKMGILDKIKSRFLLGGNKLADEFNNRWDETNAHTVSQASLYMMAGIYAKDKMHTGTMDFSQAFLYADLPIKDQCYAKIPKEESKLIIELDGSFNQYLNDDGHIYVRVVKALYGHPLAPKLWYDHVKSKFALIGFAPINTDHCIFVRIKDGKKSYICLHVDDGFIGTSDEHLFKELEEFLQNHFKGEGKIEVGNILEYLNLIFKFDNQDGSVRISQESYWEKVVKRFECVSEYEIPHTSTYMERLCKRDENIVGTEQEKIKYLSLIMSIMWGAKRTQPCILFNTTSLASQSKYGTHEDWIDGERLLAYINNNKNEYVRIKIEGKIQLSAFVDSSSNLYKDTRGHGGYVITCGDSYGGPIDTSSGRSKLNGRSSMEYELFALHNMLPNLLFLINLVNELGYTQEPVVIFEDNKALIQIIRRGSVSSGNTKHISQKYYYSKDLIENKIIKLRYCPSSLMVADILTKPLNGVLFKKLRDRLMNKEIQSDDYKDEIYKLLYQDKYDKTSLNEDEVKFIEVFSYWLKLS